MCTLHENISVSLSDREITTQAMHSLLSAYETYHTCDTVSEYDINRFASSSYITTYYFQRFAR